MSFSISMFNQFFVRTGSASSNTLINLNKFKNLSQLKRPSLQNKTCQKFWMKLSDLQKILKKSNIPSFLKEKFIPRILWNEQMNLDYWSRRYEWAVHQKNIPNLPKIIVWGEESFEKLRIWKFLCVPECCCKIIRKG